MACVLTITRRPDAILHAQFWAEDGRDFYADAYNSGSLAVMLTPVVGYFDTVGRLAAALSLLVNFSRAPLVYNVLALIIQVLPAALIVSPRFRRLVPDFRIRVLLALLYLGIPNSFEVNVNITNSMPHLGVLAAMIVLADPNRRFGWRAFDIFWVTLAGLSGPFSIALAPVAFFRWVTDRSTWWRLALLIVVLACATIQALEVVSTVSARPHEPLRASVHAFMAIVSGQIFAGAVIGLNHYAVVFMQPWWQPHSLAVRVVFVAGMAVFLYAAVRGPIELRLVTLFAWTLLVASLLTPVGGTPEGHWPALAHPGEGGRYFLIPMVAFLASLVWIAGRSHLAATRIAAIAVISATFVVGVPGDWVYPGYANLLPEHYAQVLDEAAPGTRVVIPINPPGWDMVLIKH